MLTPLTASHNVSRSPLYSHIIVSFCLVPALLKLGIERMNLERDPLYIAALRCDPYARTVWSWRVVTEVPSGKGSIIDSGTEASGFLRSLADSEIKSVCYQASDKTHHAFSTDSLLFQLWSRTASSPLWCRQTHRLCTAQNHLLCSMCLD